MATSGLFKKCIPSHSFITLQGIQGGFFTQDVLLELGILDESKFVLCWRNPANIDHLLFHCCYAKSIWWFPLGEPLELLACKNKSYTFYVSSFF